MYHLLIIFGLLQSGVDGEGDENSFEQISRAFARAGQTEGELLIYRRPIVLYRFRFELFLQRKRRDLQAS